MDHSIRLLDATHADKYRTLRLRALAEHPEAFGATYSETANRSVASFAERVTPTDDRFTIGAFDMEDRLIGVVTVMRQNGVKMRHKASVLGMHVAAEAQGKGVGRSLLTACIERASAMDDLAQLQLAVVTDNRAAVRLYASLGFESFGIEKDALRWEGRSYDEAHMVLRLRPQG